MSWTTYQSPLGTLTLIGGDAGLRAVRFPRPGPGTRGATIGILLP